MEEVDLLERQVVDGKTECGSLLPICSIQKCGVQWQDVGVIRGRKQGRPWPGYGPKSYREKKKTTCEMKEDTILASCKATVN